MTLCSNAAFPQLRCCLAAQWSGISTACLLFRLLIARGAATGGYRARLFCAFVLQIQNPRAVQDCRLPLLSFFLSVSIWRVPFLCLKKKGCQKYTNHSYFNSRAGFNCGFADRRGRHPPASVRRRQCQMQRAFQLMSSVCLLVSTSHGYENTSVCFPSLCPPFTSFSSFPSENK